MSPLELWYYRVSAEDLIERAPDSEARTQREQIAAKARSRIGVHLFPKITEEVNGQHRFVEQPPLITRMSDDTCRELVRDGIEEYRESLLEDRRFVFDRYWLEDFALRVVGIGSVGTRCYVGLFFCDDKNPLLLQVKEARRSVLEPYADRSPFENQGQRVVVGKRLMQSASDIFLGWFRGKGGRDYYVRQLRDMKFVFPVENFTAVQLGRYAEVCGWTLARAMRGQGTRRRLPAISATATISRMLWRSLPWPTPTRRNGITPCWWKPQSRGESRPSSKKTDVADGPYLAGRLIARPLF